MLGISGVKYSAGAAYVGDDKRYYRASGTSFSAPLVAGLASLMIANDPSLTNKQVINIIKSTARDVGIPGVDQYTGYGIVDARAALKAPKDYFLFASISRVQVVRAGGGQAVRVFGQTDANAFKFCEDRDRAGRKADQLEVRCRGSEEECRARRGAGRHPGCRAGRGPGVANPRDRDA